MSWLSEALKEAGRQWTENVNEAKRQGTNNFVDIMKKIDPAFGGMLKDATGSVMNQYKQAREMLNKNNKTPEPPVMSDDPNSPSEVSGAILRRRRANDYLRFGFMSTLKSNMLPQQAKTNMGAAR